MEELQNIYKDLQSRACTFQFHTSLSCSSSINEKFLDLLEKQKNAPTEDWHLCFYTKEQVRKHRKKRINKKWAKTYGFKHKFHMYKLAKESDYLMDKTIIKKEFKIDQEIEDCYLVDMNKLNLYNPQLTSNPFLF